MTQSNSRAEHLVVARESDAYNLPLIRGMILQTLHQYPHLPGHAALVAAAEKPLLDPTAFGGVPKKIGKTRAVLFEIDGTWCLYSRGTAAQNDVKHDNGFALLVSEVVRELKPRNIYVANFSRLVRSPAFQSDVLSATSEVGAVIEGGPIRLDMSTDTGSHMFNMLSMFSSMEREHQLRRTTIGRLAQLRDGRWTLGTRAVPFGYVMDRQTKKVTVDETSVGLVKRMLALLGDPSKTAREIVNEFGAKGLRTPLQTGTGWLYDTEGNAYSGGSAHQADNLLTDPIPGEAEGCDDVSALSSPAQLVARWVDLLELYETGVYSFFWTSPLKGADRYGEFLVEPATAEHPARVRLSYDLGLPDGGWAPPEAFDRIRAVRSEIAERFHQATMARATQLPFLGNLGRWEEGHQEWEWALMSVGTQPSSYSIRRRPWQQPKIGEFGQVLSPGWTRKGKRQGDLMGTVRAKELHASIASGVAEAIRTGVPARRLAGATDYRALLGTPIDRPVTRADKERTLRRELKDAVRQADGARRAMYELSEGSSSFVRVRDDAERLDALVSELEKQLNVLLADTEAEPPDASFPTVFNAEIDLLVGILAQLAQTPGPTPRAFSKFVNSIFSDLRLRPAPFGVEWSVMVEVPIDNGDVAILGPIWGRVDQHGRGHAEERTEAVVEQLMTTNRPLSDFGWALSQDGQAERRRARDRLADFLHVDLRAASNALNCAVLETRMTLWSFAQNLPLPAGVDSDFADHVLVAYRSTMARAPQWYTPPGYRQAIIDFLEARGGRAPEVDVLRMLEDAGAAAGALAAIVGSPKPCIAKLTLPCPPGCKDGRTAHHEISLLECKHCRPGTWATALSPTIECVVGVLCRGCGRMPIEDSPVFPNEYLELTHDVARLRIDAVSPRSAVEAHVRAQHEIDPGTQADMRRWARSKGMTVSARGKIAAGIAAEYQREHPGRGCTPADPVRRASNGSIATDPTEVRRWAALNGIDVKPRGRLPIDVVQQFHRDTFRERIAPRIVRRWAAEQGLEIRASGPLPKTIVEAFLDPTRVADARGGDAIRAKYADIRSWATAHGHPAPARGPLPKYLIEAFEAEQDRLADAP